MIDDVAGRTLAAASTIETDLGAGGTGNVDAATKVGKLVAERAKAAGVEHGRVRPRWVPLPRSGRRGRRRRPRSRTGVLMAPQHRRADAPAARVAGDRHQPRRQGRQGRPSLLLHRPRGRSATAPATSASATARPRRCPLAIQKGTEEARKNLFAVPLAGSHHHPPDHRRAWAPAACCSSPPPPVPASSPVAPPAPSSRRPASTTCSASRSARRTTSTSPGPRSPGLKALQAPRRDRPPARPVARGVRAQGPARAPTASASAAAARRARRGRVMAELEGHPGPVGDRHQAEAARHAARPRPAAASARPTRCPTAPRSAA